MLFKVKEILITLCSMGLIGDFILITSSFVDQYTDVGVMLACSKTFSTLASVLQIRNELRRFFLSSFQKHF